MGLTQRKRMFLPLLLGTSILLPGGQTGMAHKKEAATNGEEVKYSTHIEKLVADKCLGCHDADSPEHRNFTRADAARGVGPRLDTYSHLVALVGWPDTGLLPRNIDDGTGVAGGKPGKMYRYLGSSEDERQRNLDLFKGWAGNWMVKRWPEVTRDELDLLKMPY